MGIEKPAEVGKGSDEPPPAKPAAVSLPGMSMRCTYCHDTLSRAEALYCGGCLAPHHEACFREHGRCSVIGCESDTVVRPTRPGGEASAPVVAIADPKRPSTPNNLRARVDHSCEQCERTFEAKVQKLVDLLERGIATRVVCGGTLNLPKTAHEAFECLVSQGALDPTHRAPCVFCLHEEPFPDSGRRRILSCSKCGAEFLPPDRRGGPPRLPPFEGRPAAPFEMSELEGLADFPDAREILVARAMRGEIAWADAEIAARGLAAVRTWRPASTDRLFLPVEPGEAEVVVAALLFPGRAHTVEKTEGAGRVLVFVLEGASPIKNPFERALRTIAKEVTATASYLLRAPLRLGGIKSVARTRETLRVGLLPDPHGVRLRIQSQRNAEAPSPPPCEILNRIGATLVRQKPALEAYFGLRALYGGAAQGPWAFAAHRDAVKAQIDGLGGELAKRSARLAERLCPSTATKRPPSRRDVR